MMDMHSGEYLSGMDLQYDEVYRDPVPCSICGGEVEAELEFPFDPVCGCCVADFEVREEADRGKRFPA